MSSRRASTHGSLEMTEIAISEDVQLPGCRTSPDDANGRARVARIASLGTCDSNSGNMTDTYLCAADHEPKTEGGCAGLLAAALWER